MQSTYGNNGKITHEFKAIQEFKDEAAINYS